MGKETTEIVYEQIKVLKKVEQQRGVELTTKEITNLYRVLFPGYAEGCCEIYARYSKIILSNYYDIMVKRTKQQVLDCLRMGNIEYITT